MKCSITKQIVTDNKVIIHVCNAVRRYGKKEAGTGEHLNTFNNTINQYKSKEKGDGRMRSDSDERGERGKKNKNLGPVPGHTAARSSTN